MPEAIIDIFGEEVQDAFSIVEMTDAINIIPNQYGLIASLGIFKDKGIHTTAAVLEIKDGVLNLLPPTQRGGATTVNKNDKRKVKSIQVLNFSHTDYLYADDVQGVRAFGKGSELLTVQTKVNELLATMKSKHDITLEWLRVNALQGKILDDKGDVMLDLFEFFDTTQEKINFELDDPATKVGAKCREVKRYIEKNLKGEVMSGVWALCSPAFWDAFIDHPSVVKAYEAWQGISPLREDLRESFMFQGINFMEYAGEVPNVAGEIMEFIPDGGVAFFPMGTRDTFTTYFAPADFFDTVNTIGLPYYAKQAPDRHNRNLEILTESNPLPVCKRPDVLVAGVAE